MFQTVWGRGVAYLTRCREKEGWGSSEARTEGDPAAKNERRKIIRSSHTPTLTYKLWDVPHGRELLKAEKATIPAPLPR